MDLTTVAVPYTLAHLVPLLPPPPARIAEAGCGEGALAVALADLRYDVTGVDRNADMAATARRRGVRVVEADINEIAGEYDVVLFTRSLHHAESVDNTLARAVSLLAPGGRIVVEEFAWERLDEVAARFLYAHRAQLVASGLLDADIPTGNPLHAWAAGHNHLHRGSAMLEALRRIGDVTTFDTSMLWRLVDGRGGRWIEPDAATVAALTAMREAEGGLIASGDLPPVGLLACVRPG